MCARSLVCLLGFVAALQAQPPRYTERTDLLYYLNAKGEKHPIRAPADWQVRVGHIRASMELVMGPLLPKSTDPLAVEVKSETTLRHYTRRHISFVAEKGDRIPAYLLIPHRREGKLPAMVCLPQTVRSGKDEPAGLGQNAALAYAHELAERGYVCIVLDYPLVHTQEYKTDPYKLGYASATMKGIVNHHRGVDLLESLPFVDREAIGVIGHSLGGHNALFLAVFEPRIKAIVSSCGFNVFAKHAGGDVRAWSSRAYMPRIKKVYKDDPKQIPFDFTEVLAALAPRPVFVNAPLHDAPDFEVSGVRDCVVAAKPVYRQVYNTADRLVVHHPDATHSFPLEQRFAAYHFLDLSLRPVEKAPGLGVGLAYHWPLRGDLQNAAGKNGGLSSVGLDLKAIGPDGKPLGAAAFDGAASSVEGPALKLGKGDFSLAFRLHTDGETETAADLFSLYDAKARRGFHISLKTAAVMSCQPNFRQLQFGIDDNRLSSFVDCGRPGNSDITLALAVHEGHLYAGTHDSEPRDRGHVYRYAGGERWIDCGAPARGAVTALAAFEGQLYAGVSEFFPGAWDPVQSRDTTVPGRVYRYAGHFRWEDCGELSGRDSINGLVVFHGQLHALTGGRSPRIYRLENGKKWTDCGSPTNGLLAMLAVHGDHLYASGRDAQVSRYDGKRWEHAGNLYDVANRTTSFAVHQGQLHVGTWPYGTVHRMEDGWTNLGRLGKEREVLGMMVHNGSLYAGTLPLAEVYRLDGGTKWTKLGRIDRTPDVKYRRAWTMAEFQGQLFVSALPSGKVFAFEAGRSVTWDHELPAGWRHVVAVRASGQLRLYVDGRFAAASTSFDPEQFDLTSDSRLKIGTGANDHFKGRLAEVRLYRRALTPGEIATLARP
jgi:dienelactone hydrolase